jgi:hypothetical protein
MTSILRRARSELPLSAKWTCILAIPALIAVVLISAMLGGIEGSGGLPLTIAVAPYMAFDRIFQIHLLGTFVAYLCVAVIEWIYLFVIVFVSRMAFPSLLRMFTGQ